MSNTSWLAAFSALAVTAALGACGDEVEPTTPMTGGTTSTSTTTTTSTTSGGGMGGMGMGGAGGMGMGGMGTGGMGTGGTGGGAPATFNGCADADFQPPANPNNVVIDFTSYSYAPQCLLIPPGTDVTFSGTGADTFAVHPLRAGTVVNGIATPDPTSPIQPTSTGQNATFTFPAAGDFGYYCDLHYALGMYGAIRVQ